MGSESLPKERVEVTPGDTVWIKREDGSLWSAKAINVFSDQVSVRDFAYGDLHMVPRDLIVEKTTFEVGEIVEANERQWRVVGIINDGEDLEVEDDLGER